MPPEIRIDRIDHIVLTVRDIAATCRFYTQILGMREITSPENCRSAFHHFDFDRIARFTRPIRRVTLSTAPGGKPAQPAQMRLLRHRGIAMPLQKELHLGCCRRTLQSQRLLNHLFQIEVLLNSVAHTSIVSIHLPRQAT